MDPAGLSPEGLRLFPDSGEMGDAAISPHGTAEAAATLTFDQAIFEQKHQTT